MEELREFIPNAKSEDWDIVVAGQRVQVIKDTDAGGKGTLQFGTEVVSAADGSIAALLGASPGASTAVHVMLEVLEKCFPGRILEWEPKIKEMIPSYGISLTENPKLFQDLHASTGRTLGLNEKKLFIINDEIKNVRYIRTFLLEIILINIILREYNSLW